ncbi:MAG: DUF1702 family protein [Chitinophagales bacterium]|nr:DUF1702 family protein [Chitinophagales bacterium]
MNKHSKNIRQQLIQLLPENTRAFINTDEFSNPQLNLARNAFLEGFHTSLNLSEENLPLLLDQIPNNKLGFFIEGAGMALTLHDELTPRGEALLPKFLTYATPIELKFSAIGTGWASARLKKPITWMPDHVMPQFQDDVINGYGFYEALFNRHRLKSKNYFSDLALESDSFDLGLGRSLWFIFDAKIPPILEVVSRVKAERQKLIWKGIGIAASFNQNHAKKALLIQSSGSFLPCLNSGCEIGRNLIDEINKSNKLKHYG